MNIEDIKRHCEYLKSQNIHIGYIVNIIEDQNKTINKLEKEIKERIIKWDELAIKHNKYYALYTNMKRSFEDIYYRFNEFD